MILKEFAEEEEVLSTKVSKVPAASSKCAGKALLDTSRDLFLRIIIIIGAYVT